MSARTAGLWGWGHPVGIPAGAGLQEEGPDGHAGPRRDTEAASCRAMGAAWFKDPRGGRWEERLAQSWRGAAGGLAGRTGGQWAPRLRSSRPADGTPGRAVCETSGDTHP